MDHVVEGDAPVDVTPIGLKVVSGPAAGVSRTFGQPTVTVGRSADCQFQVDDPTVSRLHFCLAFVRGRWELTDAGSSSGTAVNGRPGGDVGSLCVLHDGDRISAGMSVVEVSIESERSDASADPDLDSGFPGDPVVPASPALTATGAGSRRFTWVPWVIGAVVFGLVAVFVATSRCNG